MRILISGGSSGIGLSLGIYYANNGHDVLVFGRSKEKFEQNCPQRQKNLEFVVADVKNMVELKKSLSPFIGKGIDLLIANAGISSPEKYKIINFEQTRNVLDTNIYGVVNCVELVLPKMLEQKTGKIVLIASLAGFIGLPRTAGYSASKAFVQKFGESLSLDLRDFGIKVTTISPGFIDTPLTKKNKHYMPFLMNVDKATKIMAKVIEREYTSYSFPFLLRLCIKILEIIPRRLYFYIMRIGSSFIFK